MNTSGVIVGLVVLVIIVGLCVYEVVKEIREGDNYDK